SSLGAVAARSNVEDDLEDRGRAMLDATAEGLALHQLLRKVANNSKDVGVDSDAQPQVLALRDSVMNLLRLAPGLIQPIDFCVSADTDCGRGPRGYIWFHRFYLARGAMGSVYSEVTMRFVSYMEAQGSDMGNTLLSKEALDELSQQAAPDDPAPILARATRRVLALRVQQPDPAELGRQLARADSDLRRVRRLAPGAAAVVIAWRAALAVWAKRGVEARAYFDAAAELCGWSSRTVQFRAFEALSWARAKQVEPARNALIAIRDARDVVPQDRYILDNRVFYADFGMSPDLAPLFGTVVTRFKGQ
ncbi:MAG: hypothetical protein ACAI25_07830, partial [Planctomycetota bacterium]